MRTRLRFTVLTAMAGLLLLNGIAQGSYIAAVSFEVLTDSSELIVAGRVVRSWAAWDANHQHIWTHYELAISSTQKGAPGSTVEFAEPGGAVGETVMMVDDAVTYEPGDTVVVFLSRMPNGYLRTTGWGQGKYNLDTASRLHSVFAMGGSSVKGTSLRTLEGISLGDLKLRINARSRTAQGRSTAQGRGTAQ
jgi:hypothetical protein